MNGHPLNPWLDLRSHSPTEFEWDYGGSGPMQLGLATLADYLGDDDEALRRYQAFKFAVVAKLPKHGWTISGRDIPRAISGKTANFVSHVFRYGPALGDPFRHFIFNGL